MARHPMATTPVNDGHVEFLGLSYGGAGLDRLRHEIGDELTEVEVTYDPDDLRVIVVRHRPTGYVGRLRCTDQIYAAMTTVAVQTALMRGAKFKALAQELGQGGGRAAPRPDPSPGLPVKPDAGHPL
ncbi:Mu transposase C-terminal domain-containing protein [Microvirga soli]|uniref:Mu transposase C-terminal domain-containing protein n=1 Tax=Microvirga soli TaxID=1854496 RepID=UPI00191EABE1|nr:Mu transposase C-terminal domain-containing protein [Microvirga soli]